jgi:D-arabinose 1-dehydrogenase-like Zn-dependent alcohol dehydrogenase
MQVKSHFVVFIYFPHTSAREALDALDRQGWQRYFHQRLFHEEYLKSCTRIFFKRARFMGVGSARRDQLEDAVRLVAAGKVKPIVAEILPLEAAAEAHAKLEAGEVVGRIVLRP